MKNEKYTNGMKEPASPMSTSSFFPYRNPLSTRQPDPSTWSLLPTPSTHDIPLS